MIMILNMKNIYFEDDNKIIKLLMKCRNNNYEKDNNNYEKDNEMKERDNNYIEDNEIKESRITYNEGNKNYLKLLCLINQRYLYYIIFQ